MRKWSGQPSLKRCFEIMAFVSLFFVLGTVGAIDRQILPLTVGITQLAMFLFCFVLSTCLAGIMKKGSEKQ